MLKNDEYDRYIRYYAHLPPDAPLDPYAARALLKRGLADIQTLAEYLMERQCSPHLLREFITNHWNVAISQPADSAPLRLAQAVMTEIDRLADWQERQFALGCFAEGFCPPLRTIQKVCAAIVGRK